MNLHAGGHPVLSSVLMGTQHNTFALTVSFCHFQRLFGSGWAQSHLPFPSLQVALVACTVADADSVKGLCLIGIMFAKQAYP